LCPHAHIFGRFDVHMLTCMYALMLTCSYLLGLSRVQGSSYSPMLTLGCSLSWLLTCLNAHTPHVLMMTCSQAHALCWSNATMPHVLTITCSLAHIH